MQFLGMDLDYTKFIINSSCQPHPPSQKCTRCGKEFDSRQALGGHMRVHSEKPWRLGSHSTSEPLPKWSVTGKRSGPHNIASSTHDDEKVAHDLMFLANNKVDAHSRSNIENNFRMSDSDSRKLLGFDLNKLPPMDD